jgi:hypothetical protein
VLSKVEQYFQNSCFAPALVSASQAASDCATASPTGLVRIFSAMMTASASGSGPSGTPITCTADIPPLTSVFARSVAPVKSSAMQPSSKGMGSVLQKTGVPSLR